MDTDIIHPFGDHAEWNESFYFNFYDRERDVCAFMRIGLKPNKDEKSMFCFLMLPGGRIVGMRSQAPFADDSLKAGGLAFDRLEPEKRWRLRYDGPMATLQGRDPVKASFDVEFETLNPVFDYRQCVSGEKERISQSVASEHLEQFGRARGSVVVGERAFAIDGLGERDHSWGVREWAAPKMWIWLTAEFSESCALNVTHLEVDQGEVDAGFFHLEGESRPLTDAAIDTAFGPDGSPRALAMVLKDKAGKEYRVTAEIIRTAMLPFEGGAGRSAVMYETLARYVFDGQTGYGIAEYLIRMD
ncbi:MAG: hypothetical protein A4E28_03240 [Methanocella sp. PtaU1.Bin125]|nr:MAG: hypothetical protein A4E28_03240 [Methanocella sp. PtaU1.Bin125]